MEAIWQMDRMRLYMLRRDHPDWTLQQLADHLKYSLSWVKKWLRRFRAVAQPTLAMFEGQSRAPKRQPRQIVDRVRQAILSLRDELSELYRRVAGPKPILYHLNEDSTLKAQGVYLPRSTGPIYRVLKEGGRIRERVRVHHPIERPEPMQHWEMDFGQLSDHIEFLSVVDRGTSILVNTQALAHYNAETALFAVARLLLLNGLPQKLRFDNDTRFVGNWRTDGYPSALMRFLLCLGVEPDRVEPGKPQHKPFVERSIRTLKYESLWHEHPKDWREAADILENYSFFYNHERANQSLACGNRPPYEAFPGLPSLDQLPDQVDPDAWLAHFHGQFFKRKVSQNGSISIGRHRYYLDYKLAGETVGAMLNQRIRAFQMLHKGQILRECEIQGLVGETMDFQSYLKHMLVEARTEAADS